MAFAWLIGVYRRDAPGRGDAGFGHPLPDPAGVTLLFSIAETNGTLEGPAHRSVSSLAVTRA